MTEYVMMTGQNEYGIGHAGNEKNKTGETDNMNAAVIVHSRTRYRDYREGLLVRPADMTKEQVYRWKKQILCCTREPEEMRAGHQVRRAVMSDGVYGAAGVAAYLRDIAAGSFEDEGRRPAYGFVGFIWKIDSFFRPSAFPSMADFKDLTERYVVPRWEEPKNGKDAEKAVLSEYKECWGRAYGEMEISERQNVSERTEASERLKTDGGSGTESMDSETALRQALERVIQGENVFYCTGLPEQMSVRDFCADIGTGEGINGADKTSNYEISNHKISYHGRSSHEILYHEAPNQGISDHGTKHRLVWAAITAGFLCGAVIWALLFR